MILIEPKSGSLAVVGFALLVLWAGMAGLKPTTMKILKTAGMALAGFAVLVVGIYLVVGIVICLVPYD